MKNKGVYCALSALFALLSVLQNLFWPLIAFLLLLFLLQKRKKFADKEMCIVISLFLLFLIRAEIAEHHQYSKLSGKEQYFRIQILDSGNIDGDMVTLTAREQIRNEKLLLKYRLKTEKEKKYFETFLTPGLVCAIKGSLTKPKSSANENSFHYATYLERQKIYWLLKAEKMDFSSCQRKTDIVTRLKSIRARGITYLQKHFPQETVPLAAALIFGTSDLIPEDTMNHYCDLGIVHLLAISGLHITIIVAMVYYLLLRVGVTREKSVIILLICLPVYAVLTGASPSVNRSVLMTMLLLFGMWQGVRDKINIIDMISVTFLLYVFISPYSIYDIGFQLSFSATFTLLLSASFIHPRYEHPLALMLATSYISMLGTAPILLSAFFEFSVISVLVNLLYIPLFNFVLLPAILFAFLFHLFFSPIIAPFLVPLNTIIVWMDHLTEILAELPWNTIVLGKPDPFFLMLYLWGFFLFFLLWEKGNKGKGHWTLFLLPFVFFAGQHALSHYSPEGEIVFLDVGQGDCILIKLPFGKSAYLIDTGGTMAFEKEPWQRRKNNYEVGEDTVVPYLKSKGITVIDKLILTHGDQDHAGGAEALLRELKVKELLLPDTKEKNQLELRLLKEAEKQHIKVRFVHTGERWRQGEEAFYILSPEAESAMDSNDASIVLYAEIGGMKWLFTGDLEEAGEEKLIKSYPGLHADVLKIGHHGSKTSTTEPFLAQISPQLAIISAGENNRFGHPHQEVLDRLGERKITILRTDKQGAITYKFRKESGTFFTHYP